MSESKSVMVDVSNYYSSPSPTETKSFIMQQTMIRIKDPIKSLDFYTRILGFKLIYHSDFPQWGFSVYFLSPRADASTLKTEKEKWEYCMNTPGCIELTWNHGTEKIDGPVYNTGNGSIVGVVTADGQPPSSVKGGFGHLGFTCADVYEACDRFKSLGCEFHKSPNSGGMKGLAFIKDPDNYLIEILPQKLDVTGKMPTKAIDCMGVALEGGAGYKDNSKSS